jgi:ribosomal protein S18 acetylase RimI-like enzyme
LGTVSDIVKPGYARQGLAAFFKQVVAFFSANESLSYYLYECRLDRWRAADFQPKVQNFTLKTVTTESQLDDLVAAGFDLSLDSFLTRRGLKKGAVVFLLFVGRELASREIVATNAAAKTVIDKYPYQVDFDHGEACASGVWTNPKFRGLGLHTYVFYRAYDYLREHGVKIVRSIVWVDNLAAQKAHARFAPAIRQYARGRYFKILGLTFCRQTDLTHKTMVPETNHDQKETLAD